MTRALVPLPRAKSRAFDAALTDRLTSDWYSTGASGNAQLKTSLRTLRNRSRDLAQNSDYGARFLQLCEDNVVGPKGVVLQARAKQTNGQPDAADNRMIEQRWHDWGKRGVCTVCGRYSWHDVQKLVLRSVARDGEILVRLHRGAAARNEFGFALQLLEADHLDDSYSLTAQSGPIIIMGVEVERDTGRPVAYHVLRTHPGADAGQTTVRRRQRLDAADVLHIYRTDMVSRSRGLPWMTPTMRRTHLLTGYEEAEVTAAKVAATKIGLITSPDGQGYAGDGRTADGSVEMRAESGDWEQLPPGYGMEMFDPQHPNANHGEFVKACLRGIAVGVGVSYASLAGDLEGANYSSLRQGALDERDHWRGLQSWLVSHLHQPVYDAWLLLSLTTQALPLPPRQIDKFSSIAWQPRGWQWVDPQREVNANLAAIDGGLKSRTDVLAEQGRDVAETFQALDLEQQLAEQHNLTLTGSNDGANDTENG